MTSGKPVYFSLLVIVYLKPISNIDCGFVDYKSILVWVVDCKSRPTLNLIMAF